MTDDPRCPMCHSRRVIEVSTEYKTSMDFMCRFCGALFTIEFAREAKVQDLPPMKSVDHDR